MIEKKIPFNKPSLVGNEIEYIHDAIRRAQLSGDGHYTDLCNAQICQLTTAHKALITHSCTAALEMAAILCEVGPGDEVILPSYTFVSTANAIVMRGATPVFVDIDVDTLNICPQEVADAWTKRTKAIFAVHYAGIPADMDSLLDIAAPSNGYVVEDAAQALGSTYKGRLTGSLGHLAAFSFHETKNIISGEGGALTINDEKFFARAEIIREKGTNRSQFFRGQVDKYTWCDLGSSFLPGELIAAFLHAQLNCTEIINARRVAIFDRYMEAFQHLAQSERVQLPRIVPNTTGNGHMFYLLMANLKTRTEFIHFMRSRQIGCPFHYVPLHSSPAGLRFGRFHGNLEATQAVSETLVRLPMYFDLAANVENVIDAVHDFFNLEVV